MSSAVEEITKDEVAATTPEVELGVPAREPGVAPRDPVENDRAPGVLERERGCPRWNGRAVSGASGINSAPTS